MGVFETRDDAADPLHRPLRVAVRWEEVWAEAKNLASDLPAWRIVREDAAAGTLECERSGGWLRGRARITISVHGPQGIPSATVSLRSQTAGALFARDRANVREFLELFSRRVG